MEGMDTPCKKNGTKTACSTPRSVTCNSTGFVLKEAADGMTASLREQVENENEKYGNAVRTYNDLKKIIMDALAKRLVKPPGGTVPPSIANLSEEILPLIGSLDSRMKGGKKTRRRKSKKRKTRRRRAR